MARFSPARGGTNEPPPGAVARLAPRGGAGRVFMHPHSFAAMLHAIESDPDRDPIDTGAVIDAFLIPDDTPTELEIPDYVPSDS